MVSGIGPADTLKKNGIDVLVDLPGVGQNEEVGIRPSRRSALSLTQSQDQPTVPAMFKVNITTFTQIVRENPEITAKAVDEYLNSQSGPFSGVGAGQGIGEHPRCVDQPWCLVQHIDNVTRLREAP